VTRSPHGADVRVRKIRGRLYIERKIKRSTAARGNHFSERVVTSFLSPLANQAPHLTTLPGLR
jgi:hypothetical protein